MSRTLYLACYDVASPRRLRQCLKVLKGYASGRQYSCFECYLTLKERGQLLHEVRGITTDEDAFALIVLQRRRDVFTLGQGQAPQDESFMWVG